SSNSSITPSACWTAVEMREVSGSAHHPHRPDPHDEDSSKSPPPRGAHVMQVPKKLNWKVTAAVGTLAGVGLGGIVLAEPGREVPVPDGVILQQDPASLTRLSAPVVVPTTSARLAADAKVTTRTE